MQCPHITRRLPLVGRECILHIHDCLCCEQVRRVVYVSCNPEDKFKRKDFVVKGGALWDNARVLCGPVNHTI